jgi:hypothetical protein
LNYPTIELNINLRQKDPRTTNLDPRTVESLLEHQGVVAITIDEDGLEFYVVHKSEQDLYACNVITGTYFLIRRDKRQHVKPNLVIYIRQDRYPRSLVDHSTL